MKSLAVFASSRAHWGGVVYVAGLLTVGFGTTAVSVEFAVGVVAPSMWQRWQLYTAS